MMVQARGRAWTALEMGVRRLTASVRPSQRTSAALVRPSLKSKLWSGSPPRQRVRRCIRLGNILFRRKLYWMLLRNTTRFDADTYEPSRTTRKRSPGNRSARRRSSLLAPWWELPVREVSDTPRGRWWLAPPGKKK